jgi:hypothetical protein
MNASPGAIGLAAFLVADSLLQTLHKKGLLTEAEGLQIWRDAAARNDGGQSGDKAEIAALLKQVAPKKAGL